MTNRLKKPVYLDYNATTPIAPEVREAMLPCLAEVFGNPSSAHVYGREARAVVDRARAQVAALLNCRPEEIVFTSGGTESNNHAIKGIAWRRKSQGRHIITSRIEHPAVTEVCGFLESLGFAVTYLPVNDEGLVDPAAVAAAITPETILITIMHANNETGAIQPIEEIAALARRHGIAMHTDAAQSTGKIPTDVNRLQVDLLSIAGHKLYAPKGIGALYIRSGVTLEKVMHGAGHEGGLRAGTENVAQIAGLGAACAMAAADLEVNRRHLQAMRDRLLDGLREKLAQHPGLRINTPLQQALPNTLNLSINGIRAADLMARCASDLACSAGSACHAENVSLSPVLTAMGIAEPDILGALRISTGQMTTEEEIDAAVASIVRAVKY